MSVRLQCTTAALIIDVAKPPPSSSGPPPDAKAQQQPQQKPQPHHRGESARAWLRSLLTRGQGVVQDFFQLMVPVSSPPSI
jgi:hypothetical protein